MRGSKHRKLIEGAKLVKQQKVSFNIETSPGVHCDCRLQMWKQNIWKDIFGCNLAHNILLQFQAIKNLPSQILGKKSSQIIISKNQKYCLKQLSQDDVDLLNKQLDKYKQFFKQQVNYILCPIYGIINMYSSTNHKSVWVDHFLLMPNLKNKNKKTTIFDIKGHCDNREISLQDFQDFQFGKDQNFLNSKQLKELKELKQQQKTQLLKIIQKNILFLKQTKVIDYSLLLIFCQQSMIDIDSNLKQKQLKINNKLYMKYSIIDYLQPFNQRKKLQNKFKSLFFKEVSSVDPEAYANRLLTFLTKNISS